MLLSLRGVLFYAFPLQLQDGQEVHFATKIFTDPTSTLYGQQVAVHIGDFWQSVPVTLVFSKNIQLSYGDDIIIVGKISKKVLKSTSVVTAIYLPKIKAKNTGFLPFLNQIRQKIVDICEKSFSQAYSSLLVRILLGVKAPFSKSITTSFRITGVTHVIEASGMNVTLVGGFLLGIVSRFFKRRLSLVITIFGILFYTLLSGLGPSIVRAAIMGIVAFSGQLFGRQYTPVYGLFLAAGVMLFWDPLLLGNVGFQLSVGSTLGIILLKPMIPLKGLLLDDIGTTFAAQIATLPILLSTFGSYGLLSLVVNALVLWTVPLLMILGGIGVVGGLLWNSLGVIILQLCLPLLWYFVGVGAYFGKFNLPFQIQQMPVLLSLGYYLLLGTLILYGKRVVGR